MEPEMTGDRIAEELSLNRETEEIARETLRRHLQDLQFWNVEGAVEFSMSFGGAHDRFAYLKSVLAGRGFSRASRCLISGSSVGSEMWVARTGGFSEVYGVEVDPFYAKVCAWRFQPGSGIYTLLYDGERLPCPDDSFDLVVSGHVVEHTTDPCHYLKELLRVLRVEGHFYLEFPSRFHYKELHTDLPSVEWLPQSLRNRLLQLLGSRYSPLRDDVKQRMTTIVTTGLQQISMGQISRCLSSADSRTKIIHRYRPVRGVVRCIIQKVA
jgi:SAM-dependent methyltransferase